MQSRHSEDEVVAGFLRAIHAYLDAGEMTPRHRALAVADLSLRIEELERQGLLVFAARRRLEATFQADDCLGGVRQAASELVAATCE